DHAFEVPARAEYRKRRSGVLALERVVVQEAHRTEAELGTLQQTTRDQVADASGPDDQGRRSGAGADSARPDVEESGAPDRQRADREQPEQRGLRSEVDVV